MKHMGKSRSCNNCRLQRSGECFGKKRVCKDYKYAPTLTEEQARTWPKEMRYREEYHLPMRKSSRIETIRKTSKFTSEKKQALRKDEISLYDTSYLNLYDFLRIHLDDIVIFGYGREADKENVGYYRVAMVSKLYMRYLEGTVQGTGNRALLVGILKALQRINKPTQIYICISTHIGLGCPQGWDWHNADLYAKINKCFVNKKCKVTVYVLHENQEQIRELLLKQNREKLFTVLPEGR